MTPTEPAAERRSDAHWYLRLAADVLVSITLCGLVLSLATSATMGA